MIIKRLVLGSGPNWTKVCDEVYHDVFLDLKKFNDSIDIVHNLNKIPWPIKDNEFQSVSAIHVLEHLDSFINFMDECWRVLDIGGSLYIETPLAGSDVNLTHSDPTHVRCYTPHSWINYVTVEGVAKFRYTNKSWCILNLNVVENVICIHLMPIKNK